MGVSKVYIGVVLGLYRACIGMMRHWFVHCKVDTKGP